MRAVLSLFLSAMLWATTCVYAQTDEVPYQIDEQATAQAPWKPGSIVAQTTNETSEEPLIYRQFLGITDQGYYVVQDFYKGSNNKQTEPFVIMQLSEVTVFKSNTPSVQGIYVQWYDNRQKWVYGQYQDGKEQGLWTWWHDNGQKESEGQFRDGIAQDLWTRWHDNGQKESEGQVQDGKQQGLWTFWFDNGRKDLEGQYQNGEPQGLWTKWNEEGKKISETMYENGKKVNRKTFD